ncbi:FAD-binding domain-containing protein, partial [Hymenopellis radicata]
MFTTTVFSPKIFFLALFAISASILRVDTQSCRSAPGDAGFPSDDAWGALNASISGHLVTAVPSGQFCKARGGCTDAEWTSAVFRANVPGAMDQVNWEQNYESDPAEICLRNTTGNCEQGNVPLYAVLATSADDVKAGIMFANTHNLRVAVKASGHDYLGRSTARDSLLISTHLLQNISFYEDYKIGNHSQGSAVTVGSGAQGKIVVGGTAGTVVAAGGYIQGGGHSALSPLLGLAADNVLQFKVVTGNAEVCSGLFVAVVLVLGVIVSATFRTFPTFNGTVSSILSQFNLVMATFFPNVSAEAATSAMQPLLNDISIQEMNFNDAVTSPMMSVYRDSPDAIGQMYTKLFEAGSIAVLGHLVAGGKVTENAYIDSAVNPKWRSAKTHMILHDVSYIAFLQMAFQTIQLPIMEQVIDSTEPNFQTTFYGPNYAKLSAIKSKYDPADLFIVAGGVGSERWDADGFCKLHAGSLEILISDFYY